MQAWLEKRLATEYPGDTYRALEWGEPESVMPHDWVTIPYKFIVSSGEKPSHYYQGHRRYTFTKTGDFVRSDYVDGPEVEVSEPKPPFGSGVTANEALSGVLSEKTQKIMDALLADIDHMAIVLEHQPQGQPNRHSLMLRTDDTQAPDFYLCRRVTGEQMKKLLVRLAAHGYFDRASGGALPPKSSEIPPKVKNEPG